MDRFQCGECGQSYAEPERYTEAWGEERAVCPLCGAPENRVRSCKLCGAAVCDGVGVCAGCARRYCREHCDELIDWLKQKEEGLGYFSWTDIVVGFVYGVSECRSERLLLEALPVPEISGRTPDGREMRRALWAYVCEDGACLDQVRAWIAEEE